MLILPSEPRLLPTVPKREWHPSLSLRKDQFGNDVVRTRFVVTARLHDGHVAWRGVFLDRDDADAFLWAVVSGSIVNERALWDLPVPCWHPDIGYGAPLAYDFVTTVYLTSTGANTWTSNSDYGGIAARTGEFIDCIGGGASGGAARGTSQNTQGGSGPGWSRITTLSGAPSTNYSYTVGTGGTGVTQSAGGSTSGNSGADTFFNGASLGASSVGAKAGTGGGVSAAVTTIAALAGGAAASGVGTTKNSGGSAGAVTASPRRQAVGGGGAAGPNGNGTASSDCAGSDTVSAGGSGDAGSGGAGSAGNNTASASPQTTSAGSDGTEYDGSHGSGGASGGCSNNSSGGATSGAGGQYGASTGGAFNSNTGNAVSGNAGQGLIAIAYVPAGALIAKLVQRNFTITRASFF